MADDSLQIDKRCPANESEEKYNLEMRSNEWQPLKLRESESGQFNNCIDKIGECDNSPSSSDQHQSDRESCTPSMYPHQDDSPAIDSGSNAVTIISPEEKPMVDVATTAVTVDASSEQLHADLNSIICELQSIATYSPEIGTSDDVFQESAIYLPKEKGSPSDINLENDQIEFFNSVMEDLTAMAESIELDLESVANRSEHPSVTEEAAAVDDYKSQDDGFLGSVDNASAIQNTENAGRITAPTDSDSLGTPVIGDGSSAIDVSAMNEHVDDSSHTVDMDESTNEVDTKSPSDCSYSESDNKTATAARKRYASTKTRKVDKNQDIVKSDDASPTDNTTSTERYQRLKDENTNEETQCKQSRIMQFLIGQNKQNDVQPDPPQLKKSNSADFNVNNKSVNGSFRPCSMSKAADYHIDFNKTQPESTKKAPAFKLKDILTREMKQRDPDLPFGCDSRDEGTANFSFVESPHLAEVHIDSAGRSAAAGATGNAGDNTDDDDSNDVVLDMEELLRKLDLSDKVKRQIRKASQLSFQLQNAATQNRSTRDIKRWKSLDNPTYNRVTSTPSPTTTNPLRQLRPWKIPLAIKMMKNLRKQQSSIEEDRLSLEFFVPGKKTTIRLHRRTFINFLLKYSIFFFTFIFWIGSLSCISYGTWMLTHKSNIIDNVTDVFLDPYVLLCVVGAIVFIVAFIGCLGALRENIYLLKIFHVSLTLVVVLESLLGTLVFLFYTMPEFRSAVKVGPEEVLKSAVKGYFDDEVMRNWIDTVQKEFGCCGVSMSNDGYLDWQENQYFNCSDTNPSMHRCSVPLSCCIFEEGDFINYMCGAGIIKEEPTHIKTIINTKGCMKSFGEWLAKNDSVIGYSGLGLIGLQILGVVSGRYFIKHLRECDPNSKRQSDRIQIGSAEETSGRTERAVDRTGDA